MSEADTREDDKDTAFVQDALERAESAGDGSDVVTGQELLDELGDRSFGPLLLLPSLILVSPASAIVGLPTVGAIAIALISLQTLAGRDKVWLPKKIRTLRIKRAILTKTNRFLLPVARIADRLTYPRLSSLVDGVARRIIAGTCLFISVLMPPLEIIPMGNTTTAAAIATFALAITARDGLLAVFAFGVTAAAFTLVVMPLL